MLKMPSKEVGNQLGDVGKGDFKGKPRRGRKPKK